MLVELTVYQARALIVAASVMQTLMGDLIPAEERLPLPAGVVVEPLAGAAVALEVALMFGGGGGRVTPRGRGPDVMRIPTTWAILRLLRLLRVCWCRLRRGGRRSISRGWCRPRASGRDAN